MSTLGQQNSSFRKIQLALLPKFFVRGLFLASKNNQGSLCPCLLNYRMTGWWVYKIKNVYLRNGFR